MKKKLKTTSEQETKELAKVFGSLVKPGQVILLEGNLGSGKTVFAKGLAIGLGISETVNSPTFNIVKCYFKGRIPMFHIDAYRLEGNRQDIGLDEYIYGNGVTAIEWPKFIDYLLPKDFIRLEINRLDEVNRDVSIESFGKQSDELLGEVSKQWN